MNILLIYACFVASKLCVLWRASPNIMKGSTVKSSVRVNSSVGFPASSPGKCSSTCRRAKRSKMMHWSQRFPLKLPTTDHLPFVTCVLQVQKLLRHRNVGAKQRPALSTAARTSCRGSLYRLPRRNRRWHRGCYAGEHLRDLTYYSEILLPAEEDRR